MEENNVKKEIGERIKLIRTSLGMPKEVFGRLFGATGQYVGIIEKGNSNLSMDKLVAHCEATNISADFILFGKDTEITLKTRKTIRGYTDKQIMEACDVIGKLAIFIKNGGLG